MSLHTHFTNASNIIQSTVEKLVEESLQPTHTQETTFSVFNVDCQTVSTKVTDLVVSTALRPLYLQALDATELSKTEDLKCDTCKKTFFTGITTNELEISLRIMEALRKRNILASCSYVTYDLESKTVNAYLRKTAQLKTQQVVPIPPIYLQSFDILQEVAQREYAITTSKSLKPILATWHLVDCVAVAGFSSQHQIGFLFHIDNESNIKSAIKELIYHLKKSKTSSPLSFNYILVGGADKSFITTADKRKKAIESLFSSNSTSDITFQRKEYSEKCTLPLQEFEKDSFWSRAVRLSRSVAIDCTQQDPLAEPMSYEPQLNPYSVFHKRDHTKEETDRFYSQTSSTMKCVYKELS